LQFQTEDFFTLIEKLQSNRLEDQRCSLQKKEQVPNYVHYKLMFITNFAKMYILRNHFKYIVSVVLQQIYQFGSDVLLLCLLERVYCVQHAFNNSN